MRVASNTLVRNGMPFIRQVLEQVKPYMAEMHITVSRKSTDDTLKEIEEFMLLNPDKVILDFEDVAKPADLTGVRQKQLDESNADWILFLDDDDWWSDESLRKMMLMIETKEYDAFASNPIQLIDDQLHDAGWGNKWFTKWFRKQEGVHYAKPYPRDLIYKGSELLYWKTNANVPKADPKFFHLSYLKNSSFRNEAWAEKYKDKPKVPEFIDVKYQEEVNKIWKYLHQK